MTRNQPPELDIDLSEDYIVGLLDYLAGPRLYPEQTSSGYRLVPSISITLRKSGLLAGILHKYLTEQNVDGRIQYRDDAPNNILIERNASIIAFYDIMREKSLQLAEELEYLEYYINTYEGVKTSHDQALTLSIFKTWAELHPEWQEQDSRKYTLEFFKNEFGIDCVPDPEPKPEPVYPGGISEEYIAGTFDAIGHLLLQVRKGPEYTINHTFAPQLSLSIANPSTLVLPHFKKFFSDRPISPSFSQEDFSGTIVITGTEDLTKFLKIVAPHVFYHYEKVSFFLEDLLPAYEAGYHREKEGFLDCLRAYEEVIGKPASSKLDVRYFENLWEL
jgi:hypothetical protein